MKTKAFLAIAALAATTLLSACGNTGGTRNSVTVVGSSTVYPFAKKVSELLALSNPAVNSPIIESTGTGAGMNLFCKGLGAQTPDVANASRRMKLSEFETCQSNDVTDIIELQVGLDGIAFASAKGGIMMNLTPDIVYRALAARPYGGEQTTKLWSDVEPSLPDQQILVYGPPSSSGTRDALKELILEKACKDNPKMATLKESDEDLYDQICTEVREDSAYVSQGEQDNLIVQKIENNSQAVGIFGYSYLEENADKVQGLPMNGVDPTYANISSFAYPGARPLYIYVKKAHLDAIPGLKDFMAAWVDNWQRGGPLAKLGLVASPDDVMAANAAAVADLTVMTADGLK